MFGIGAGEMIVIFLLLLFAVGPDRMPTFMRAVGKGLREFRRTTRELRHQVGIDEMLRDESMRDPLGMKQIKRDIRKPLDAVKSAGGELRAEVASIGAASAATKTVGKAVGMDGPRGGGDARIMGDEELRAERPEEGVDVAHARQGVESPGTTKEPR